MIQLLVNAWKQIGLAVGVFAVFLGIYYYPDRTPFMQFESTITYSWILGAFAVWIGLLVLLRKPLWQFWVKGFPTEKASLAGLVALLVFSSVYIVGHSEARYRMLSDEHNHLQVAMSMHYFQRAERCDEGNYFDTDLQCHKFVTDIRPKAYPMMVYLGYSLFGFREWVPFALNFMFFLLTALLIFRLAHELGCGYWGQLFSVMAWVFWPVNVWWVRTAGYEMSYVFFVALGCWLSWWMIQLQQPKERLAAAALLGVTVAFACQTRHEAYVMMPVILAPAVLFFLKQSTPAIVALMSWAIAVVPGIVVRAAFKDDFISDFNGAPGAGFANLGTNLPGNLEFLFNVGGQWPSSFWVMALAVLGMFWIVVQFFRNSKQRASGVWVLAWFWCALLSISYFYWGKFQLFAHMRYSVPVYVPIALLVGYFAQQITEWRKQGWVKYAFVVFFAVWALRNAPWIEGSRLLNAILLTNEDHHISEIIAKLPENAVFAYTRPAAFLVRKRSSYSYSPLLTPGGNWFDWAKLRSGGEVYYIRGLDCWRDKRVNFPEIDAWNMCEKIETDFELQEFMSFPISGNYNLKVMKVLGPKKPS